VAQVVELHDEFVKGKKTRRGRWVPNDEKPAPEPVVTLIAPGEIDRFLGASTYGERLRHLRRLRDEGLLIHNPGLLLQRVSGQGVERAYVFRCQAHDVPRVERGSRPHRKTCGPDRVRSF
jgi:hypothetical protein